MPPVNISYKALMRLPGYLQILKDLRAAGEQNVTATAIARRARLNEIQVRKDISAVSSSPGKPMVGFAIDALIADIDGFLSYTNVKDAVLVGAGALGRALLNYPGLAECGMEIVAAFDINPALTGVRMGACEIYPARDLKKICRRLNISTGIICVPVTEAQAVCDELTDSGVRAIWNFAPTFLKAPKDVLVQNENLASSLAVLIKKMPCEEGARR